MDKQVLHETKQLTCSHLSIDSQIITDNLNTLDDLIEGLTPIISDLLNRDMERLLNALYRIDVDESKFKLILSTERPELVASSVSKLIIERELQKAKTRIKYRSGDQ